MSVFHPVEKSFWLHRVCEANYRRLMHLVPDLPRVQSLVSAAAQGKPALHLRVLERGPYTLTIELTHDFSGDLELLAEPAVRIRICLDARTAEVLSDRDRPGVHEALATADGRAVLDYKWNLNYFLARWLDHCLSNNYRFGAGRAESEPVCALTE